jgi:hypothetical protein
MVAAADVGFVNRWSGVQISHPAPNRAICYANFLARKRAA